MATTPTDSISIPDDFQLEAIATDMDGTFFGTKLCVPDSTLLAYRRAIQMGVPIIPATGRVLQGVENALKVAGANEVKMFPGVYLNGCTTYGPDGEILWESHVPACVVEKMVEFERRVNERFMSQADWQENPLIKDAKPEHGFKAVLDTSLKPVFVTLGGHSCGGIVFAENNQLADGLTQLNDGTIKFVGSLTEHIKKHPIHKLLFVSHCGALVDPFRPEIQALLHGDASINTAIPRVLEIAPKGVNKAEALAKLTKLLGLSLQSIACLGDGENDKEMLMECGYSVAMGNASPDVKAVANATTKSNNEDGWAMAVHSLLNKREQDSMKKRTERGDEMRRDMN